VKVLYHHEHTQSKDDLRVHIESPKLLEYMALGRAIAQIRLEHIPTAIAMSGTDLGADTP
jgi:hypothetical protein